MKKGSTLILRGVVVLLGLIILGLLVFVLPAGLMTDRTGFYKPILLGLYVPAIPFFIALWQTMKLLGHIDTNTAFTRAAVGCLGAIKYCAVVIATLFLIGLPYIYYAAQLDDAPGVMAIGCIIIFASFVIATFAAVLQGLLRSAVAIKSENDLTV
ncbi:DUF2975 domain-containing protein [Candidatus Saccharibacteria bacterium]|nr:DUF2975 domain-containing protein [Candidatus Saccharibacteria bacterium]